MPGPLVKELVAYRFGDQDILQRVAEILKDGTMAFKVDLINADWDIGNVHLLNIANAKINPSTEETLLAILAALGGATGNHIDVFGEANSVASSTPTSIVSYTVPVGKKFHLRHVDFSGTNIGTFWARVNAAVKRKKRTYFTEYNGDFFFEADGGEGLMVTAGQKVEIMVEHVQSTVGDFSASLSGREELA